MEVVLARGMHRLHGDLGSLVTWMLGVELEGGKSDRDIRDHHMLLLCKQEIHLAFVSPELCWFEPEHGVDCGLIEPSLRGELLSTLVSRSLSGRVQAGVYDLMQTVLEPALHFFSDRKAVVDSRSQGRKFDSHADLTRAVLADLGGHLFYHLSHQVLGAALDVEVKWSLLALVGLLLVLIHGFLSLVICCFN